MNRNLHRALLVSLALHGLILFGLTLPPAAPRREPAPLPIEARLVEAPPAPLPRVEEPPKPPPPARKQERRPKPAPQQAKPAPEPAPQPSAAPPPVPPVAEVPPAPAPPPPSTAAVEPQPAPAQSDERIVVRTREEYRLLVMDAARSHNRYPPLARENNWEGQVLVYMTVGADGRASLSIKSSSGHPVLDRQALEMFRRAQAAVPLPPALRGKEFSFELKAIYNLKDQVSG